MSRDRFCRYFLIACVGLVSALVVVTLGKVVPEITEMLLYCDAESDSDE